MSAGRRRSGGSRRRALGQNFLTDPAAIEQLIHAFAVESGEPVLEIGAGRGALTIPLARAGARVTAVEVDPFWATRLRELVAEHKLGERVRIVQGDFRSLPLPSKRYRVIANPPFGLTTSLLARLLDDPGCGPWRADVLVQWEVARKRTAMPPTTLRSAAWAPWWTFELGPSVPGTAFRPVPAVDAALLIIERRRPPLLPVWLAAGFRDLLRPGWKRPQ